MSQFWKCTKCGVVLEKKLEALALIEAGARVTGQVACGDCGTRHSNVDIYAGQFDCEPPPAAPVGLAPGPEPGGEGVLPDSIAASANTEPGQQLNVYVRVFPDFGAFGGEGHSKVLVCDETSVFCLMLKDSPKQVQALVDGTIRQRDWVGTLPAELAEKAIMSTRLRWWGLTGVEGRQSALGDWLVYFRRKQGMPHSERYNAPVDEVLHMLRQAYQSPDVHILRAAESRWQNAVAPLMATVLLGLGLLWVLLNASREIFFLTFGQLAPLVAVPFAIAAICAIYRYMKPPKPGRDFTMGASPEGAASGVEENAPAPPSLFPPDDG